jgi:eukaryotic translation initiation factor 2C
VVIRHAFVVDPACTVIGRGFYYQTDGVQPLGGGAEIWPGFQQASRAPGCSRAACVQPGRPCRAGT